MNIRGVHFQNLPSYLKRSNYAYFHDRKEYIFIKCRLFYPFRLYQPKFFFPRNKTEENEQVLKMDSSYIDLRTLRKAIQTRYRTKKKFNYSSFKLESIMDQLKSNHKRIFHLKKWKKASTLIKSVEI